MIDAREKHKHFAGIERLFFQYFIQKEKRKGKIHVGSNS
jgi:hypothetical protein